MRVSLRVLHGCGEWLSWRGLLVRAGGVGTGRGEGGFSSSAAVVALLSGMRFKGFGVFGVG